MLADVTIQHYTSHRTVKGFWVQPNNADEALSALHFAKQRGLKVCPMGAQNSFGDIFLADGQLHISLTKMNRIIDFNRDKGEITVESGVRICDVLRLALPAGYYLSGLSGSYSDTVGGMTSSNCHGKDSWKHGNFGNNILNLKLITATGSIITVDKEDELMKAVLAGLGLMGIIIEITLKLKQLPSLMVSASERKMDIKALADFEDTVVEHKYAWIDMLNSFQASIVRTAAFDLTRAGESMKGVLFPVIKTNIAGLSPKTFWKLVSVLWNPATYPLFNHVVGAAHQDGKTKHQFVINYLYPWRKYPGNKYLFKQNSFYELQTLFPREKFLSAFTDIRELVKAFKISPVSSAVKWHRADNVYLSFSGNGLSITNTFDSVLVNTVKGKDFLKKYTELVTSLDGKFYLSKYPYISPNQLKYSFPGFEQWLKLKHELDPENIFLSDTAAKWITA
ncbi:MAG: FAD/FMN-containing dehydrogenase [Bacteroidota bacterium]|nr:FAD/FMN-containing dehydrogenase [Bacteroidota bacterium]